MILKMQLLHRSLLSRYVLNPFWTWFVTLWPVSVAPNTVCCLFLVLYVSAHLGAFSFLIDHIDGLEHRFL